MENTGDRNVRVPNAFGSFPVLHFLVPLVVGITLGHVFAEPFLRCTSWLWAASVVLAVLLVLQAASIKRQATDMVFYLAAVLFFAVLGFSLAVSSTGRSVYGWPDKKSVYSGVIVSVPKVGEKVVRLRVKTAECYDSGVIERVGRMADIGVMRTHVSERLTLGDAVMFHTRISKPENSGNPYCFDYASYLKLHGVSGSGFVYSGDIKLLDVKETARLYGESIGFKEKVSFFAEKFRRRLLSVYKAAGISGDKLASLSAMTLGDKTLLDNSVRTVFADAGVSHVLALSGLHFGIIYSLLQFLLTFGGRFRRMRIPAQIIVILFIWAYAFTAGLPLSLLRAAVMYSVVSLCVIFGREAASVGNLYLAAFAILLFNPLSLFDVGFQLSFVSVFCILKFLPAVAPARIRRSVAGKVWCMVAVSLCAQIGVTPLVVYYFHAFPTYFIISNLLAVPLASFVVVCGFLLLVFSWFPAALSLSGMVLNFALVCLHGFLTFMSGMPCSTFSVYPPLSAVVLAYVVLFLAVMAVGRRQRLYAYPAVAVLVSAFVVYAYSRGEEKNVSGVYCYRNLSVAVVQFVVSRSESYLYSPPEYSGAAVRRATKGIASDFWRRCEMRRPVRIVPGFENGNIHCRNHLVLFGNKLWCMLDSSVSKEEVPGRIDVGAMYVAKGFKGNLSLWLDKVRTPVVVLDSRISDWWRGEFIGKCRSANVKVYDLSCNQCLKITM